MQSRNSATLVASETTGVQKQPLKQGFKVVGQPEEPPARCEASPIREHGVQLPDPEYRQVAGYVRRKTGNAVRADPAPSHPPPTSSTPPKRRPNQRKKGSRRPGNGSGSDSDTDSDSNGRPKRDGHSISGARRRAAEPSDVSEPCLPNRAAIEREESDRMKLFRTLQKVTNKWHDIRLLRRDNQEAGEQRRQILLRHYDKMSRQCSTSLENPGAVMAPPSPELLQEHSAWMDSMVEEIKQWNTNQREFLDEVLHGDIEQRLLEEGQSGEVPDNPSDYLEDVLGQVESNVISRCMQFDPSRRKFSLTFHNAGLHLMAIVKDLYRSLWRHLSRPENEAADVAVAVTAFVKENCPEQASSQDNSALTNAYMARIVEGLVEAVLKDRSTAQLNPDVRSLRVLQIIGRSRDDYGQMTLAYLAWMCSNVETKVVEQSYLQWQKGLRAEAVKMGRVAMKAATEQELCQDINRPGVVSLVLLKDNAAQTIKDLSASELRRIGWFYQWSGPSGYTYLQHRIYRRNSWDSGGAVFRVSMDEEILGVWMPNGTFLGWDEVQDETY